MTQSCLKYKNNFGHLLGQLSNYSLLNAQTCIIHSDTEDLYDLDHLHGNSGPKCKFGRFLHFCHGLHFHLLLLYIRVIHFYTFLLFC